MPTRSPHDEPTAPTIPSFASLRSAPRRSAVDLLIAGPGPEVAAAPTRPAPAPAPRRGPVRPAEYGDLLRLGVRLVRAAAGVPGWVLARVRTAAGR